MEHCGRLWKRAPLRSRLQLNFMLKFSKNVHTFQFYSAHDSIISICKSELCDILRSYVIFFVKLFCFFLFLCVSGCWRCRWAVRSSPSKSLPISQDLRHSTRQGLKQIEATNVIFHAVWEFFFDVSGFGCNSFSFRFSFVYLDISWYILNLLCSLGSRWTSDGGLLRTLYSTHLCMYWDRFAPDTAGGAWSPQVPRRAEQGETLELENREPCRPFEKPLTFTLEYFDILEYLYNLIHYTTFIYFRCNCCKLCLYHDRFRRIFIEISVPTWESRLQQCVADRACWTTVMVASPPTSPTLACSSMDDLWMCSRCERQGSLKGVSICTEETSDREVKQVPNPSQS